MTDTHQDALTGQVTVTRVLDASRDRVWAAWTQPGRFARWFGTPPYATPSDRVAMDVRPGGRWSATQVSAEDGSELPFTGTYLEVVEPTRLVFTFEDPADATNPDREIATLTLADEGGKTRMTLHQAGHLPAEQYDLLAKGYGLFFDRLVEYLASE